MDLYRAEEDYLKVIYELTLERNKDIVKTNEVTELLGFTDQSVNEMIRKLESKSFVKFIPYKGVSLTKKGEINALKLIRAHRIWEVFLITKLSYDWKAVHNEAEKLEHASSDELIEQMYQFLGRPNYCQHGNPIPNKDGVMMQVHTKRLTDFKEGSILTVKRVLDNYSLLNFIDEIGLSLEDKLLIELVDKNNGYVKVKLGDIVKHIPYLMAKQIFGE